MASSDHEGVSCRVSLQFPRPAVTRYTDSQRAKRMERNGLLPNSTANTFDLSGLRGRANVRVAPRMRGIHVALSTLSITHFGNLGEHLCQHSSRLRTNFDASRANTSKCPDCG